MATISQRNLRAIDLNLLVIFDALMVEKNLTRVGERHGLSQPAVSKALNRLRDMFDDPLFVRCDRMMQPTPRARELASPIHVALGDISRTFAPTHFDPSVAEGRIRVASIDLYHTPLLPALVRHLRDHAPGVDLHVRPSDSFGIRDQLMSGDVDLALCPCDVLPTGFRAMSLWTDRLVTLVGERFGEGPLTMEQFAAASHVVDAGHVHVAPDGRASSVVDATLGARGLRRRIALVLPTASGLPFIVASTDLIATLPRRIASGLGLPDGVKLLPPPFDIQVSPHLLWHESSQANPLLQWVRGLIQEIAGTLRFAPDGSCLRSRLRASENKELGSGE